MHENLRKGTIKTSPLSILESVIAIEILVGVISIIISLFIHYEELYAQLPIKQVLSFNIFSIIALSLTQTVIVFISFIIWYSEKYFVDKNKILYTRLAVSARPIVTRDLVLLRDIESIMYSQNIIQRMFGVGSLKIKTSISPKPIKMNNIPNPVKTVKFLNSFRLSRTPLTPAQILKMISGGENRQLEFKSGFLWDYQTSLPNKELNKPVIKSLASFLNSTGGLLIIGVNDQKQILGIEPDLKLVKRQNTDGFENLLTSTFNNAVGIEFNHYLDVAFKKIQGKFLCLITVRPSNQPVYVKYQDAEEFFVRSGNSSRPLSIREATEYIQTRFRKRSSK